MSVTLSRPNRWTDFDKFWSVLTWTPAIYLCSSFKEMGGVKRKSQLLSSKLIKRKISVHNLVNPGATS